MEGVVQTNVNEPTPSISEHGEVVASDSSLSPWNKIPKELRKEIGTRIMGFVFEIPENTRRLVKPGYRKGMLAGYIRTGFIPGYGGHLVETDNVDMPIQVMQVNSEFRALGSAVYYQNHTFEFDDPDLFRWWIKHIGTVNLSNVSSLSLTMNSGFQPVCAKKELDRHGNMQMVDMFDFENERSDIDLTSEEKWYNNLSWLRSRHQLKHFEITFEWPDPRVVSRNYAGEIHEMRGKIMSLLMVYRNIALVRLFDLECFETNVQDCQDIALLMMQKNRDPPVKHPKLGLAALMDELRICREMKEQREAPLRLQAEEEQRRLQVEEDQSGLEEEQRRVQEEKNADYQMQLELAAAISFDFDDPGEQY